MKTFCIIHVRLRPCFHSINGVSQSIERQPILARLLYATLAVTNKPLCCLRWICKQSHAAQLVTKWLYQSTSALFTREVLNARNAEAVIKPYVHSLTSSATSCL